MSADAVSGNGSAAALVADACLLTAAALCVLVFAPPFALLIGPGAAWVLHDRRIDRTAAVGCLIGVVAGLVAVGACFVLAALLLDLIGPIGGSEYAAPLVAVGACFVLAALLLDLIGPIGGSEYAAPIVVLVLVGAAFLVLVGALDVAAVRDLMPARRIRVHLDVARLVSTAVIVVFAAVVTSLQTTRPSGESGDAGVFALGAGAVGAVTMMVMSAVRTRADRRSVAGAAAGV